MNQATFTFYWSLTGIFIFVVSRKLNHTCNYLWFFQYPIIQNGILNFFLWRWNSLIYYALYFSSPCAIIKFYWFSVFFVMSNTFNHNKFINQSCIASLLRRISGFPTIKVLLTIPSVLFSCILFTIFPILFLSGPKDQKTSIVC